MLVDLKSEQPDEEIEECLAVLPRKAGVGTKAERVLTGYNHDVMTDCTLTTRR